MIEFARGIDNLVGFYSVLSDLNRPQEINASKKTDYYFDVFLQTVKKLNLSEYLKEIERYNETIGQYEMVGESVFFSNIIKKYPEFEAMFEKQSKKGKTGTKDIIQFLEEHSPFLQKEENKWIITIMEIVRKTSLYFQPQIRSKILNEGWASYWHEKLFMNDDRIRGNEVAYARVNSFVTALPRVGINPYALGMRLFAYLEEMADKGKISHEFKRIKDADLRKKYDTKTGKGLEFVFRVREDFSDFMFINTFIDQDFIDKHKIFVVGKRLNSQKGVWEYYIKSRKAEEYREMLLDSLYHPPYIEIDEKKTGEGSLYLNHRFEGKPLVKEFVENTMLGIEYLWGGPIKLETTEFVEEKPATERSFYLYGFNLPKNNRPEEIKIQARRVLYTMENKKLTRSLL